MAEKWYIIEQFGKVGPFALSDLLSGVERGDFDYTVELESDRTQKRTTLAEVISQRRKRRKKRASSQMVRQSRPTEPTQVVPKAPPPPRYVETAERRAPNLPPPEPSHVYRPRVVNVEARPRSRSRRKTALFVPAMLLGGVLSLALFYGLREVVQMEKKTVSTRARIIDLPEDPDKYVGLDSDFHTEKDSSPPVIDVRAIKSKAGKTGVFGPITFSRSELYRCQVKCKIKFKGVNGGRVTGVFFAQAFKNQLLQTSGEVHILGRVSANGRELYVQEVRP